MRYHYYHYTNKQGQDTIVAVSSYAGRTVKGYAKCAPGDTFDEELGKELARARCDLKIAEKRQNRAYKQASEARDNAEKANARVKDMQEYLTDSTAAYNNAVLAVGNILNKMGE